MAQQMFHNSFHASAGCMDSSALDVSNRLAREQIARQVASSTAYRRQQQQQPRVFKPVSTGNSPQNLARRRQAAGPRLQYQSPDVQHAMRRRAATAASGRPISMVVDSRPVSWQPNGAGMTSQSRYAARHSMYEVNQQLDPFQTIAMNGLPTPVVHAQTNDMPMDACFSLASSPEYRNEYAHVPVSNDWSTEGHGATQLLTPASNYQAPPDSFPVDYMQASFALYQQMMSGPAQYGLQAQTAPPSPDVLVIQKPEEASLVREIEDVDDGPELVGMGLYDSTPEVEAVENSSMGMLDGGSPTGSNKLMKLCDSWTPPEEDEDDSDNDDDEDEDDDDKEQGGETEEDDEEEVEDDADEEAEPKEDISPVRGSNQLPQGDLSNKSFLLDEEDALGAAALAEMTMSDWRMMNANWA